MSIRNKSQNPLVEYYEQLMLQNGKQQLVPGYSGIGFWYHGYPSYTNTLTNYGAMSTALPSQEFSTQDGAAASDTSGLGMGGTAAY